MSSHVLNPLALRASVATFLLVLALASSAGAQERHADRAHMELSFAPGWGLQVHEQASSSCSGSLYCGFGTAAPTDAWLSLVSDLRLYAPEDVGFALRIGVGWGILVIEPGAAYELDLHTGTAGGIRLQPAGGLAIAAAFAAAGPRRLPRRALRRGAAGIDFRHGDFFAGVALDARAMARPGDGVAYGVLTSTIRVGGEWGL